ncbi:oligopeptide transport ATP-binding protein AppF [Bacillus sp. J14TS2]|uniref:ABC transporter ATP-binding protein n=1 Tax=Bacillus sp. J14TS2 TaxID=2807188 RepID=UPI001B17267B|nr:dipeptide ABC transporter ATP-binding protein [Bacillus sp. J14TS2]GIN72300.1 oligopeptide transport ATP-binding protein AppF [Bacillus sp. J14TS2]
MSLQANKQEPILQVQHLKKYFPVTGQFGRLGGIKGQVKAVNDVSFDIYNGETLGIVGESGCGKSTTGRTILRLMEPTAGKVLYQNQDLVQMSKQELRRTRKDLQMVFQDPYSSLNPRKNVGQILEEPLNIHAIGDKKERRERTLEMLNKVGLGADYYYRYPHEFSGGQRQRLGLARALILNPKVIICDEPVSALDVSIQSQVLNLLEELQDEFDLTYLFITHDISVVRHISDRIGVMYLGKIVEEASTDQLFAEPLHPYTKALFSAVPRPNMDEDKRERIVLKGDIPSPLNPPTGCMFHTRCPFATEVCKNVVPERKEIASGHYVSCHLY